MMCKTEKMKGFIDKKPGWYSKRIKEFPEYPWLLQLSPMRDIFLPEKELHSANDWKVKYG